MLFKTCLVKKQTSTMETCKNMNSKFLTIPQLYNFKSFPVSIFFYFSFLLCRSFLYHFYFYTLDFLSNLMFIFVKSQEFLNLWGFLKISHVFSIMLSLSLSFFFFSFSFLSRLRARECIYIYIYIVNKLVNSLSLYLLFLRVNFYMSDLFFVKLS